MLWPRELSKNTSVQQLVVLAETREGQVWVDADVPIAREETDCFLWIIQQCEVVGCCPGLQALTVRRCFVVTPVDMLAVEVTNIQTRVQKCRDGGCCESQAWRFVDVNDLVSCNICAQPLSLIILETDRPVTTPTTRGQTWQGRGSCSGLTQLVKITSFFAVVIR